MNSVALRLQNESKKNQTLVLAGIAETRSTIGRIGPAEVAALFDDSGLPRPAKTSNLFASLERDELLSRKSGKGAVWRLTPKGRHAITELFSEIDLSELLAESVAGGGVSFAATRHPLVPLSLAPPELTQPLARFLEDHPFDRNVFGMTRYPDEDESETDPVGAALTAARESCAAHGLEFHLASERSIVDDLWSNVAGHMWGSRYGIALFENRMDEGLNPNLAIETGSMLMTGRRCALLKDVTVTKMPTDLVGKIYKEVDLDDPITVGIAIHGWIRDDLGLRGCSDCPGDSDDGSKPQGTFRESGSLGGGPSPVGEENHLRYEMPRRTRGASGLSAW